MAWEYHKVEVAWASQPDATFPIYTDETSRVDPKVDIVITRGRQTEVDTIEPSTLSLAFNNPDHRFTPGNAYSPLYPNVKPARKIRVSETIDGITYYLFTGYILFPDIEAWAQAAPGSKWDQTITITAVDRLGRLDQAPAIRSNLSAYIAANTTDLVAWYPLDESTPVWKDALGLQPPILPPSANTAFNDTYSAGGPAVGVADDGASVTFSTAIDNSNPFPAVGRFTQPPSVVLPNPISTASGTISISYWAVRSGYIGGGTSGAVGVTCVNFDASHTLLIASDEDIDLSINPTVSPDTELFDGSTGYNAGLVPTGVAGTLGVPFFVTIRVTTPSLLMEQWFNGQVIASRNLTRVIGAGTISTLAFDKIRISGNNWSGRISQLQIRNGSTWGFADHVAQYQAGMTGLARQTPGQRIATVLGYAGVAAADLSLDSGTSVMVAPSLAGQQATTAARTAAATDSGELFTAGNGQIVFHARDRRYNAPVAATIDLTWLTGQWRHRVQPPINAATITSGNGTSATTVNAASQLEYGQYNYPGNTSLASAVPEDASNLGAWLTTFYAAPAVRAPAMTVDLLAKSNTIRHTVLAREISDRIAISGLPVNAPEGIGAQFIEGIQHRIRPLRRTVTFNTSPLVGYLPGTTPTWPVVGTAVVATSTLIPH